MTTVDLTTSTRLSDHLRAAIPAELQRRAQWIGYALNESGKKPINVTSSSTAREGVGADSGNPSTWASFQNALDAYDKGYINAIGYEFDANDIYVGIDLDGCRDKATGLINDWALEIIQRFSSYTEISQSGTGIHIIIRCTVRPKPRRFEEGEKPQKIEMYGYTQCLMLTGNHLDGTPSTIATRNRETFQFIAPEKIIDEKEDTDRIVRRVLAGNYAVEEGYPDMAGRCVQEVREVIDAYREAWERKPESASENANNKTRELSKPGSDFYILMSGGFRKLAQKNTPHISTSNEMTPLPQELQYPAKMAEGACDWLDREYIPFSRAWSPRSYEPYHEACGLWILSVIAGRRVHTDFMANGVYTNLNIMLVADSSIKRKTTAMTIAKKTLAQAGLDWRVTDGIVTPQKFVKNRVGYVRNTYSEMNAQQRDREAKRVAASAQMGWVFDEFGEHLNSLVQQGSIYGGFSRIFRKFDDCEDTFAGNDTVARDEEIVELPYLAMLGGMTYYDMKNVKKASETLWGNGYFGRFVVVAAPKGRNQERSPKGKMIVPGTVVMPLVDWDKELGVPQAKITEICKGGNPTGEYEFQRESLHVQNIFLPDAIEDAFYNYLDFLEMLVDEDKCPQQIKANYVRLPIMALRIALLFASLSNRGRLEMKHWVRAQQITEQMRVSLHLMLDQVNVPNTSEEALMEERILSKIELKGMVNASMLVQQIGKSKLTTIQAHDVLQKLKLAGRLQEVQGKKGWYELAPEE